VVGDAIAEAGVAWPDDVPITPFRDYGEPERFAALLAEAIPGCTFEPPAGGLSLWVRLPGDADAAGFASRALRHGVSVAPGPFASPTGGHEHLRLCHDRPDEELAEGAARLAAAWADTAGTPAAVSSRP
jgi:DNA-binding transcriptional MocR family regulator